MKTIVRIAAIVSAGIAAVPAAPAADIASPDGRIVVTVSPDGGKENNRLCYRVAVAGTTVIEESPLGFELENGDTIGDGFAVVGKKSSAADTTWKPVCGERSTVRDRYRELTLSLARKKTPPCEINLVCRCYDAGAAFRYVIRSCGGNKTIEIKRENTTFRFPADHTAWSTPHAQGTYTKTTVGKIHNGAERPLTIRAADNRYIALAEAALVDYARMKFRPAGGSAVVSRLDGGVSAELPLATPWRVVMIADSPGRLLENNDIIRNLNRPCAIEDPSWIRPGKVIREVTLTTKGGKACVDFAAAHNLQFVEYDAGWYGHEYDDASDATTVTVDPKRSPGPLDLRAVIDYAAQKNIGIIVYVNRRALEKQLDRILPLYRSWGIAGVKYGFVRVGSQRWTAWLHEAVRKAARHRLMVDVHDEYRPTGYSRTYPNLMTQEGIRGDEARPANELTLTILFTRMLAGAGDNTVCYFDKRVTKNACHAYQLAKTVCIYSPWTFLFWYDTPGEIGEIPEMSFFENVPTTWDDTRVIHGRIGEYAVIARRSGARWFIGAMNGSTARTLAVGLDFLEQGKPYRATVYSHDETVDTRTHVRVDRRAVSAATVIEMDLPARGGQAVMIAPAER